MIQLGQRPSYPVRDDECYWERLAIILESWDAESGNDMDPYRLANEAAHRTRYSHCATAALHGDWQPLMQWMAEVTFSIGSAAAVELWFEIAKKVERERGMRGMQPKEDVNVSQQ